MREPVGMAEIGEEGEQREQDIHEPDGMLHCGERRKTADEERFTRS